VVEVEEEEDDRSFFSGRGCLRFFEEGGGGDGDCDEAEAEENGGMSTLFGGEDWIKDSTSCSVYFDQPRRILRMANSSRLRSLLET